MSKRDLPQSVLAQPVRSRAWWRWGKRALTFAFFAAVALLLASYASHIHWDEVADSLLATPTPVLAQALLLAGASHLLYSCFDLIGRRYTGHTLPTRSVMAVNFVSYAFNLCIGSLVGGVGFRYRLYSQYGLKNSVITRIVSMSLLTNWLGYKLLAGLLFIIHPLRLPPSWHMGNHGLEWVGTLLVLVSAGYIGACVYFGNHVWDWRGHEIYLPPWRMALLQYAISAINWSLMAGVIWVLIGQRVDYADVLTVLLIGAIAGVIAHVPAGLGVFEFVFVALLSHVISQEQLIAALLGYRAIYYILPLIIASMMYFWMEVHVKRSMRLSKGEA
jgi:glycosyltransferase 2 family protein